MLQLSVLRTFLLTGVLGCVACGGGGGGHGGGIFIAPDLGPDAAVVVDDMPAPSMADLAGITPICTVPVGFLNTENGRDRYAAFTNVDSMPGQTCPVHTSTNELGDIQFSFYSGSPGYTIDGRGNYVILSASPATLMNVAATSAATASEDHVITMTFQQRVFADQDASVPPPIWTMTFMMKSDPDPTKWAIELFSFSHN